MELIDTIDTFFLYDTDGWIRFVHHSQFLNSILHLKMDRDVISVVYTFNLTTRVAALQYFVTMHTQLTYPVVWMFQIS